jgi:hypothetical protein
MDITERLKELHAEKRERSPLERLVRKEEPEEAVEEKKDDRSAATGNDLGITHYEKVMGKGRPGSEGIDALVAGESGGAAGSAEMDVSGPGTAVTPERHGAAVEGGAPKEGSMRAAPGGAEESPGVTLGSGVKVFDLDELSGDQERSERARHAKLVTTLVEQRQYEAAIAAIREMAERWPDQRSGASR